MILYLLTLLSLFQQTIDQIGFHTFELTEDFLFYINVQSSNLTAYVFSTTDSSEGMLKILPPNNETESLKLTTNNIFCTDSNIHLFAAQNLSKITIWVLPSSLCGLNARIFHTGQRIFSRWIFTQRVENLCYFPLNSPRAEYDLSFLVPAKIQLKGSATIYREFNGIIRPMINISNDYAKKSTDSPFFIHVHQAVPESVFAYDFVFQSRIQDICIDQQLLYFNSSLFNLISKGGPDRPVFACSNNILNSILIQMIVGLLTLILICVFSYGIYKFLSKCCQKKPQVNRIPIYE